MHGAIVSLPRLIASWTTGVAKSTSQVTKMTCAPLARRFLAQVFARAGLLLFVSQVSIRSGRPLTPPFALIALMWMRAAASAGPSNGAMFPLLSNAHPMTIAGFVAADVLLLAPASAATATAVPRRSAAATPQLLLRILAPPESGLNRFRKIRRDTERTSGGGQSDAHEASRALTSRYMAVWSGTSTPRRSASRTRAPVIWSISVGLCASTSSSIDG